METAASDTSASRAASIPIDARSFRRIFSLLCGLLFCVDARSLHFVRSARSRTAEEQLGAIGQGQIAAVRAKRTVLRLIAIDTDDGSDLQGVFGDAASQQDV